MAITKVVRCRPHGYEGGRSKAQVAQRRAGCEQCDRAAEDDRYQVQVYSGSGSNLKKTVRGLKVAEGVEREFTGQVRSGDVASGDKRNITFRQLLTEVLDAETHSAATKRTYGNTCKNHLWPALGDLRVKDLQNEYLMLVRFLNQVEAKSGASARRTAESLLRRTLRVARRQSVIQRDPLDGIKWPPLERVKGEVYVPTLSEAGLAREHIVQQRRGVSGGEHEMGLARHDVLFGTGMRIGEMLAVAVDDVDRQTSRVRVVRQLGYLPEHGLHFKPPKAGSVRSIPVPGFVMAAINASVLRNGTRSVTLPWEKRCTEQELATGEVQQYHTAELIFFNLRQDAGPVAPQTVANRLRGIGQGVGLPGDLHAHSYRHLYTSILENARVPQTAIDEVTGHKAKGNIAQRVYSHAMERGRQMVVPAIEQAWAEMRQEPEAAGLRLLS